MDTLQKKGLIYKKQGLGTFVRSRDVTEPLIYFHNFVKEIDRAGYKATSKVLSLKNTKVA